MIATSSPAMPSARSANWSTCLADDETTVLSSRPPPPAQQAKIELRYQQGLLPPPEQMAAYERILAGATDRFFKLVESEAEGRRARLATQNAFALRGQALAFLLMVGAVGTAVYALACGFDKAAAWIIGAALGSGTVAALFSRKRS
jgi:uncharacterized membrane protein